MHHIFHDLGCHMIVRLADALIDHAIIRSHDKGQLPVDFRTDVSLNAGNPHQAFLQPSKTPQRNTFIVPSFPDLIHNFPIRRTDYSTDFFQRHDFIQGFLPSPDSSPLTQGIPYISQISYRFPGESPDARSPMGPSRADGT